LAGGDWTLPVDAATAAAEDAAVPPRELRLLARDT